MIYGLPGIGKSTWAASAPGAVIIPCEDGVDELAVDKFPLATCYRDVLGYMQALVAEDHDYGSVVIDTVDWLERMIWDEIVQEAGVSSIERVDGGYGRGYVAALRYWRELCAILDRLRLERGMIPILVAHAKVERYEDPEGPAYDRWVPRLHKQAAAILSEWCDVVGFAAFRKAIKSEDAGFGRKRNVAVAVGAASGQDRILRVQPTPSVLAKNRYGIVEDLLLSFDALAERIRQHQSKK